jgi:hypothetical protein
MAARRSRAKAQKPKEEKQDKSGNILLAPSMTPRLLRNGRMDGANRHAPHCDLSTQAPQYRTRIIPRGNCVFAGSTLVTKLKKANISGRFILPYRRSYAFAGKTAASRINTPHITPCTKLWGVFWAGVQVNLPTRIPWLLIRFEDQ